MADKMNDRCVDILDKGIEPFSNIGRRISPDMISKKMAFVTCTRELFFQAPTSAEVGEGIRAIGVVLVLRLADLVHLVGALVVELEELFAVHFWVPPRWMMFCISSLLICVSP